VAAPSCVAAPLQTSPIQQWLPVRNGKLFGISGMALVGKAKLTTASFLIVR